MIFSVGKEIDRTICKGKETLFVSGWQPKEEILARAERKAKRLQSEKYHKELVAKLVTGVQNL